jgi:hypothetical protein
MRTITALAFVLAGCAILSPATGPNSPWGPCYHTEHACQDGACCLNSFDCGGETPGCPQEVCCYAGDDTVLGKYGAHDRTMWKRRP